ncbi:MAG: 50S ribosomal protein L39e [Candidatus Micrarchaeota archaeon]
MMSKKTLLKKKMLAKAKRTNRRIPAFVVVKTARKVSYNPNRRNWRTTKLRIKE